MKRILMIFKDDAYSQYAEHIMSQGIEVSSCSSFEEALELIPESNPGIIVSINYFSKSYDAAVDTLIQVRQVTSCKIYMLSGSRPPVRFIQQADEIGNIEVKWGKEIDIDIDSIPETEHLNSKPKPPSSLAPLLLEETQQEKQDINLVASAEGEPGSYNPKEETSESAGKNELSVDNKPDVESLYENDSNSVKRVLLLMEKDLEEKFRERAASKYNIKTAEQVKDLLKNVENISAIILSTGICEKNYAMLKNTVKAIPKMIKLYAIDNITTNQLIYGELGEIHGIKFYRDFESIIEDIEGEAVVVSEEKEKDTDLNNTRTEKGIIKNLSETMSGILQTTRTLPRPTIVLPKLSTLMEKKGTNEVPKKKQADEVRKVQTYIEREKVMLFLSPMTTGKTELSSNVAYSLSQKGIKTALVDMDLSKKGLFYQFPILSKEDLYTYRLFSLSLMDNQVIDEPLELAFKANKNLYVFTTHRDIEIPFTPRTLDLFIRYLKRTVDVIVVDVGRNLPQELIEKLLDASTDKYLVATQDISVLNTLPYMLKWFGTFPSYYRNWNLVVNRYRPLTGLKDSEIEGYFFDADTSDLKFEITKMLYVPDSCNIWEKKTQRAAAYGSDTSFDAAIDEISYNWMFGKSYKGGVTLEV